MMDILELLSTMTQEFEAHGKIWIRIQFIATCDEGSIVMACEKGISYPAPIHLVIQPREKS
jgi:hypothetical protein